MVVADNRAYDYSKRQYLDQFPLEQPQKQPQRLPEAKPKKKVRTGAHIFKIAFIFVLSVFVISRYAYVAELGFGYRNLKESYNQALRDQTDLNVKIMKTINLDTLEKTSIEKLGMQYPDMHTQIVYVKAAAVAPMKNNADSQYHDISDVNENKYIAYLSGMLTNLLKVLD